MVKNVLVWFRFGPTYFLLIMLLCGCGGDPYKSDYTETASEISVANIIGTYVPTADTATKIKNEGRYPAANTFIKLFQNKTFQASNIPDWWRNSFGESKGLFDSGSGKWSLIDTTHGASIKLQFNTYRGLHATGWFENKSLEGFITLVGHKPPYLLHTTLGDPENGDAMQFEKVVPSKTPTAP